MMPPQLSRDEIERAVLRSQELGASAFKRRDYKEALTMYEAVVAGTQYLEDVEELAKALSNRSACKLLTRDARGAVDDARQCVKLNGAWPKGWYRLGRALLEAGRAREAEAALTQGLKLDPTSNELATWRAKAHDQVQAQRAQAMKERRYKTDYSKFETGDDEVASLGPVVESIEEMHDLMQLKQKAQLDKEVKISFRNDMIFLPQSETPRELDEASALAGLATWLADSSLLDAPKRLLDSEDIVDVWFKAVREIKANLERLSMKQDWVFVGAGSGRLSRQVSNSRVFAVHGGPWFGGDTTPLESVLDGEALVLVLDPDAFDEGLLGRRCLPYVRHCRRHMCVATPLVVPSKARLFVAPVRVTTPSPCGLDFSAVEAYRWGPFYETLDSHFQDIKWLAAPQECFVFDFAAEDFEAALPLEDVQDLKFDEVEGVVNGVAFYFELETPFGEVPRWLKAAVQWIDPVTIASSVTIRASHNSTRLRFKTVSPEALPIEHKAAVSRWHLDMIADERRNRAFEQGIIEAMTPGARVVDFGTGTGLLAFLAKKHGAGEVTGVDTQGHLCELAEKLAKTNSLPCAFIKKDCRHLVMGKDLKKRCDLLVMELFDYGFLGEGALHFVHFAWHNCLTEDAKIVPRGGTIYAMLVELICDDSLKPYLFSADYYGIDLTQRKHKRMSAPFEVFTFDFMDKKKMKLPPTLGDKVSRDITITENGTVNAVVFWHDLDLPTRLSTSPDEPKTCWLQACQTLPETTVGEKDIVCVTAKHQGSRVTFALESSHLLFDPAWLRLHTKLQESGAQLDKTLTFNPQARQDAVDAVVAIAVDPARFAKSGLYIDGAKACQFAWSFFLK